MMWRGARRRQKTQLRSLVLLVKSLTILLVSVRVRETIVFSHSRVSSFRLQFTTERKDKNSKEEERSEEKKEE